MDSRTTLPWATAWPHHWPWATPLDLPVTGFPYLQNADITAYLIGCLCGLNESIYDYYH